MDVKTATHSISVEIITLSGRLDALEAAPLRNLLLSYSESGSHNLVVDLSKVEFVDSAGLAALVKGMKDARANGGDLRIVRSPNQDAARVFALTKFDQVFVMGDSSEELISNW